MMENIRKGLERLAGWFLKPTLDLVYRAALQFLKFWRDAKWGTKLATLPILALALIVYGLVHLLRGGCE